MNGMQPPTYPCNHEMRIRKIPADNWLYYYVSILWKVVEHICLKNHLFTTHNGVRQVKTDKEGFKSFNLQNKYYITYACTYDKIT